jgi:Raf kinase inhibitor-like YbhB/YbcL family protein
MQLQSSAFKHEGLIPAEYSCDGDGVSPELIIKNVPSHAKSLVLIMDDPDVPVSVRKDRCWDHWVVFNIPPNTTHIPKDSIPQGTLGKNTSGTLCYQGPCPPDREHRYFFKLYALDCKLDLSEGASKSQVEQAIQGHILEKAELMGKYKRI